MDLTKKILNLITRGYEIDFIPERKYNSVKIRLRRGDVRADAYISMISHSPIEDIMLMTIEQLQIEIDFYEYEKESK